MQAHFAIAHVAFNFSAWNKCGNRIYNNNINGAGTDQVIGDLKCLLPIIGLRYQQVGSINAKFFSIKFIKGMFRIYKSANAALLLSLGYGMQGNGGFTTALRTVYLHDPSTRKAANPQ